MIQPLPVFVLLAAIMVVPSVPLTSCRGCGTGLIAPPPSAPSKRSSSPKHAPSWLRPTGALKTKPRSKPSAANRGVSLKHMRGGRAMAVEITRFRMAVVGGAGSFSPLSPGEKRQLVAAAIGPGSNTGQNGQQDAIIDYLTIVVPLSALEEVSCKTRRQPDTAFRIMYIMFIAPLPDPGFTSHAPDPLQAPA